MVSMVRLMVVSSMLFSAGRGEEHAGYHAGSFHLDAHDVSSFHLFEQDDFERGERSPSSENENDPPANLQQDRHNLQAHRY